MYPWAGRTTQTLIRGAGEICFIVALLTGSSIADPGSGQAGRHMPPTFAWGPDGHPGQTYKIYNTDGRPAEHQWRPLFNAAKFG